MTKLFRTPNGVPMLLITFAALLFLYSSMELHGLHFDEQSLTIFFWEGLFILILAFIVRRELLADKNTRLIWPLFVVGIILLIVRVPTILYWFTGIAIAAISYKVVDLLSKRYTPDKNPSIAQQWAILPIIGLVLHDKRFFVYLGIVGVLLVLHYTYLVIYYWITRDEDDSEPWKQAEADARYWLLPQLALAGGYVITVLGT